MLAARSILLVLLFIVKNRIHQTNRNGCNNDSYVGIRAAEKY